MFCFLLLVLPFLLPLSLSWDPVQKQAPSVYQRERVVGLRLWLTECGPHGWTSRPCVTKQLLCSTAGSTLTPDFSSVLVAERSSFQRFKLVVVFTQKLLS